MRPISGKSTHAPAENLLLAALSGRDLRPLPARFEQVELVLNDVLYQPGELISNRRGGVGTTPHTGWVTDV